MMTIEKIIGILSEMLAERPGLGTVQKWNCGEAPYCFEIFQEGAGHGFATSLGRVMLSAREIVGFNNASDEALRDLMRPKVDAILQASGVAL
jgi:hypothetical protein